MFRGLKTTPPAGFGYKSGLSGGNHLGPDKVYSFTYGLNGQLLLLKLIFTPFIHTYEKIIYCVQFIIGFFSGGPNGL
jgi:hypothetical protein